MSTTKNKIPNAPRRAVEPLATPHFGIGWFGRRVARVTVLIQWFALATATSAAAAGLAGTLGSNPDLTLFSEALAQSGLADQFEEGTPFTVFAPSDTALANEGMAFLLGNVLRTDANRERLTTLLSYHIVRGVRLDPATIAGHVDLITLQGELLSVVRPGQALGVATGSGTSFVTRKIETEAGVIFVVDRLIWPDWQSWPEEPVTLAAE